MHKIISREFYSEKVLKLEIDAPRIAKARKAGHFVMVRADKKGERIPLTIAGSDAYKGTIILVIQKVGVTSAKLFELAEGEYIADMVGPLGKATDVSNKGTILAAAGGVGVAPMLPIIEAMKKAGNRVVTIIAARSKDLIILEDQVRKHSDELIIMTNDGSYGEKGLITEGMEKVIKREKVDEAITIGPAIMMKFCAQLTERYKIPTVASLNTIMVDGTGMCGACRVTVNGKTRFVCVDGPEFDAHQVNFEELLLRLNGFKKLEQDAMISYEAKDKK